MTWTGRLPATWLTGMLEMLRAKAARQGLEVETVLADAASPPGGPFDAVVGRHLMWTLPEPRRRPRRLAEGALPHANGITPAEMVSLVEASPWGQARLERLRMGRARRPQPDRPAARHQPALGRDRRALTRACAVRPWSRRPSSCFGSFRRIASKIPVTALPERVALGGQLAPGLRYRGPGKVGAVAAEQHGPVSSGCLARYW